MQRTGFTLIELLIVVAIIGILAAIAVPNFLNAQSRAQLTQVISNMKSLSTAILAYSADYNSYPLHDPPHRQNIVNNALTTPVAYIGTVPLDIFMAYAISKTDRLAAEARAELHPEPFYTTSGGAYGNPAMDGAIPAKGSGNDLTLRFIDNPTLWKKAQNLYPIGRYIVSVGPDLEHTYPYTYDATNGLKSRGDIIWVVP